MTIREILRFLRFLRDTINLKNDGTGNNIVYGVVAQ